MNIRLQFTLVVTFAAVGAPLWLPMGDLSGHTSQKNDADALVRALGDFQPSLPGRLNSDGGPDAVEARRLALYGQLVELGARALPALSRGLADPDVRIRRNVALFLNVSSMPRKSFGGPMDITASLPALVVAVQDQDERVRHLSGQAIGNIGSKAASAVPALIKLLQYPDEGSRNSACIGLAGIGPSAAPALPALRSALSDSSEDVRRFARRAIDKIEPREQ